MQTKIQAQEEREAREQTQEREPRQDTATATAQTCIELPHFRLQVRIVTRLRPPDQAEQREERDERDERKQTKKRNPPPKRRKRYTRIAERGKKK